ncbi:hypothetical protein AH06_30 [Erwinia phage AH06]|nr:hypothetical protein AH06_30 [Erwinia phage AH06]
MYQVPSFGKVINPELSHDVMLMSNEQLGRYSVAAFDLMALNNTIYYGEFGSYVTPTKDAFMTAYLQRGPTPEEVAQYIVVRSSEVACMVDSIYRNDKGDLMGRLIPYGPHGEKLAKLMTGKKLKYKIFPRLRWENGWKFVAFDIGYK